MKIKIININMTVGELQAKLSKFNEDAKIIVKVLGPINDEYYNISNVGGYYDDEYGPTIICEY